MGLKVKIDNFSVTFWPSNYIFRNSNSQSASHSTKYKACTLSNMSASLLVYAHRVFKVCFCPSRQTNLTQLLDEPVNMYDKCLPHYIRFFASMLEARLIPLLYANTEEHTAFQFLGHICARRLRHKRYCYQVEQFQKLHKYSSNNNTNRVKH